MNITKSTLISDILINLPHSADVFHKYHMECSSCTNSLNESLETACLLHCVDADIVIKELQLDITETN